MEQEGWNKVRVGWGGGGLVFSYVTVLNEWAVGTWTI